jgi:hypothetical protein
MGGKLPLNNKFAIACAAANAALACIAQRGTILVIFEFFDHRHIKESPTV